MPRKRLSRPGSSDQKTKILVFGFLFNMLNHCKSVRPAPASSYLFSPAYSWVAHKSTNLEYEPASELLPISAKQFESGDQKTKILVFGFLFNMLNHCKSVLVVNLTACGWCAGLHIMRPDYKKTSPPRTLP